MRLRQLLQISEAPIEDIGYVGDWNKGSSFRHATDRRLLTNPRYVERIKNMFANTPYEFRMWFVNNKEALIGHAANSDNYSPGQRAPFAEEGLVSPEWMQQNMPETFAEIQQQGGFGEDAINVLFTNNQGAERRPMTGWIIAHRLGHAMLRTPGARESFFGTLYQSLQKMISRLFGMYRATVPPYRTRNRYGGYEPVQDRWGSGMSQNWDASVVRSLLASLGTFKSARDNNLRTAAEFIFECFAQYIFQGQVTLNAPPPRITTGYAWGRPQQSWGQVDPNAAAQVVQRMTDEMNYAFEEVLAGNAGSIFVM